MLVFWIDWAHFPLLSFLGWLPVAGINVYHWVFLKSFMDFEDQGEDGETAIMTRDHFNTSQTGYND